MPCHAALYIGSKREKSDQRTARDNLFEVPQIICGPVHMHCIAAKQRNPTANIMRSRSCSPRPGAQQLRFVLPSDEQRLLVKVQVEAIDVPSNAR